MKIEFPYGRDSFLDLDLPDESVLYSHAQDAVENIPLSDLPTAVTQALENPLNVPPLRECLMSDDHLVIPVAPMVPHIGTILQTVLEHVFSASPEHQPRHATILQTKIDEETGVIRSALEALPFRLQKLITLTTHRPDKKEEMAFLGVSETNETLVIHRELFDAEFVLPIGFFLPKGTPGHAGIHTAVYPTFSDRETHRRFKDFGPVLHAENHKLQHELEEETAEATRQLGVLSMLQVVPGLPTPGSSGIARILAGDYRDVESDGYSLYREIWTNLSNQRPQVVLASVTGVESTSWHWAMRALECASKLVDPDEGAIVLCSDLAGELPPEVEIYRQVQDLERTKKMIHREELPDDAQMLAGLRVLNDFRVFFVSDLDPELLEDVGIIPLEGAAGVERLVQYSGSVTLLPDVHRMIF
ncbi:MAG: DUF2088 domain-containing protein [Thermoguttaceae bacterium]|nr:DUF2088 domain-containing protein [Thermoguttaceae bacterium]